VPVGDAVIFGRLPLQRSVPLRRCASEHAVAIYPVRLCGLCRKLCSIATCDRLRHVSVDRSSGSLSAATSPLHRLAAEPSCVLCGADCGEPSAVSVGSVICNDASWLGARLCQVTRWRRRGVRAAPAGSACPFHSRRTRHMRSSRPLRLLSSRGSVSQSWRVSVALARLDHSSQAI